MRFRLYSFFIILILWAYPIFAVDEEKDDDPSSAQAGLMQIGFQVFKEPVEAPDFTLKNLEDEEVSLSSFRGKLVLLNFWATWCPPCRAEMPSMQEMYEIIGGDDFVLLAVDLQESKRTVKNFIEKTSIPFPCSLMRQVRLVRSTEREVYQLPI